MVIFVPVESSNWKWGCVPFAEIGGLTPFGLALEPPKANPAVGRSVLGTRSGIQERLEELDADALLAEDSRGDDARTRCKLEAWGPFLPFA